MPIPTAISAASRASCRGGDARERLAVADADAGVAREQRLRERLGAGPDLLGGAGLLDRAQRDDLAVAHADQRRALAAAQVAAGDVDHAAQRDARLERLVGLLVGERLGPAQHDHHVVRGERDLQRAREPADALGVALARHQVVEQVAAHDLAVAPDAVQLLEEGVGHVARHLVDVAHDAPGDHERRLAGGRVAVGGLLEHRLPEDVAPQPRGPSEGLQRDALVDPARAAGAQPGELPVVRVAALLEQVEQDHQLLVGDRADVAGQLVVDQPVVGDLVADALDDAVGEVVATGVQARGDRGHRGGHGRVLVEDGGHGWSATLRLPVPISAMKITTSISINVEGESEALRERVLELAQQEIMRYSAALADRLEEEGIEDVTIGIEGDE